MKIEFKAENWTGETAEVVVHPAEGGQQRIEVHGDEYILFSVEVLDPGAGGEESDLDHVLKRVFFANSDALGRRGSEIFSVLKFRGDVYWTAIHGDTVREATNPFVTAAKMICMVV